MTPERAAAAYDLLVQHAGADHSDRYSFIFHVSKPRPTTEYRFGGLLGHGGKFRNPSDSERTPYVDCYPEDLDERRRTAIAETNEALVALFSNLDDASYASDPDVIEAKKRFS
jgi:hypothetical protein